MRLTRPDDWVAPLLDAVRPLPPARPRPDRARHPHRARPRRRRGRGHAARRRVPDRAVRRARRSPPASPTGSGAVPHLQTADEVAADLRAAHERLAAAGSVVVVGGGAAAVSSALNVATRWPDKQVDLCFPGDRALPQHHPRVWSHVRTRLSAAGVTRSTPATAPSFPTACPRPDRPRARRAGPPARSRCRPTPCSGRSGGSGPTPTGCPRSCSTSDGFVRVLPTLQSLERPEVFAIGDVAATDPLRSSARNRADHLLADNIRAHLAGKRLQDLPSTRCPLGLGRRPATDGLQVFAPSGRPVPPPDLVVRRVMYPWIVRRGIYKGVVRERDDAGLRVAGPPSSCSEAVMRRTPVVAHRRCPVALSGTLTATAAPAPAPRGTRPRSRARPRCRPVRDVQRLPQPQRRGPAGQRPVDARQPAGAQRRRDHPAGRPGRRAHQRVRLRARGSRPVPRQLPRGRAERRRPDRVPVRVHRAVQHRRPERLRPQQQRRGLGRRRRLRLRALPRPVRPGRLLEVPDPDRPRPAPSSTSCGRTCRARCCPTTRRRPRPPTGTHPRSRRSSGSRRSRTGTCRSGSARSIVHFLVSHPTPPTFDGAEDRNGTRNHDEIRFWADYIGGRKRVGVHLRRRGPARRPQAAAQRS